MPNSDNVQNQLKDAQSLIRQLIEQHPNNADVWYVASHASRDPEQQKKALERALRINPDHAQARARLAKIASQPTSNAMAAKPAQKSDSKAQTEKAKHQPASRSQPLSTMSWMAALVVVCVILAGLIVTLVTRSQTASSAQAERIAFFDGNELYLIKPDGTEQTFVYKNSRLGRLGQWSTDGTLLTVFSWSHNILSLSASGDRRFSLGQGSHVSLSPDGRQAAVDTYRFRFPGSQVAVVNVDGSSYTRITPDEELAHSPEWSPRGDLIAFTGSEDNTSFIYTIRPDGSNRSRVAQGTDVKWSPDGQRLLFSRDVERSSRDALYRINVDGSNEVQIAPAIQYIPYYSWSPDGRKIAYIGRDETDWSAYYLRVTNDSGSEILWQYKIASDIPEFAWSPDSQKLVILLNEEFTVADLTTKITKTFTTQRAVPPEGFVNNLDDVVWLSERQVAGLEQTLAASRATWEKAVPPQPYYFVENTDPVRIYRFDGLSGELLESSVPKSDADDESIFRSGFPSWSPDGTQFVYTRPALTLMNIDGSNRRKLVSGGFRPRWSPDGTHIGYFTPVDGDQEEGQLYVIDAAGGDPILISDQPVSYWEWSPDGQQIAFSYERTLTIVNADGTNARVITENGANPYWSPDGQSIAFVREGSIWIVPVDGSQDPTMITEGGSPAWSPDGTRLVFLRGGFSIATINVDGSDLRVLTRSDAVQYAPTWSPDGLYIAYWENRDGEIFPRSSLVLHLMLADGSGSGRPFIPVPRFGDVPYRMEWPPDAAQAQLDTFTVVQEETPTPTATTP